FSPDDTMLALARDGLGVWDTTTGQEIRRFGALPDNTLALQFGADERILLVSGSDETLVLRDLATQKVAFQHKSAGRIGFAAVAPDGKYLALADTDNKGREYFRVLDAGTGKELPALSQREDRVLCAAFSPDSKTVAISANGLVRLVELATGKEVRRWKVDVFGCLAFAPDGKRLAAGDDTPIHLRDLAARN